MFSKSCLSCFLSARRRAVRLGGEFLSIKRPPSPSSGRWPLAPLLPPLLCQDQDCSRSRFFPQTSFFSSPCAPPGPPRHQVGSQVFLKRREHFTYFTETKAAAFFPSGALPFPDYFLLPLLHRDGLEDLHQGVNRRHALHDVLEIPLQLHLPARSAEEVCWPVQRFSRKYTYPRERARPGRNRERWGPSPGWSSCAEAGINSHPWKSSG